MEENQAAPDDLNEVSSQTSQGTRRDIKSAGSMMATVVSASDVGFDSLGEDLATRAVELSLSQEDMAALMIQNDISPKEMPKDAMRWEDKVAIAEARADGRNEGEDILKTIDQIDGLMGRAQMMLEVPLPSTGEELRGRQLSPEQQLSARILGNVYSTLGARANQAEEESPTNQDDCADAVVVTGVLEHRTCLGTYVRTDIHPGAVNDGRCIYKGPGAKHLYYWSDISKWVVGDDYNSILGWLCSSHTEGFCPTQASSWKEMDTTSGEFKQQDAIKVQQTEAVRAQAATESREVPLPPPVAKPQAEAIAESKAPPPSAVARAEAAVLPFRDYYKGNMLRCVPCSFPQKEKAAPKTVTEKPEVVESSSAAELPNTNGNNSWEPAVGDRVEVYSNTRKMWCPGEVQKVINEETETMVLVSYTAAGQTMAKEIGRGHPNLRLVSAKQREDLQTNLYDKNWSKFWRGSPEGERQEVLEQQFGKEEEKAVASDEKAEDTTAEARMAELRDESATALKDATLDGTVQESLEDKEDKDRLAADIVARAMEEKIVAEVKQAPRIGEAVQVYSNSAQDWLSGTIESVGADDMVKVQYKDKGKWLEKEIKYDHPHLRRGENLGEDRTDAKRPSQENKSEHPRIGEQVEVFSNSMNKWLLGYIEGVETMEGEDVVKVVYFSDGKQFGKEMKYTHPHVRPARASRDDRSEALSNALTRVAELESQLGSVRPSIEKQMEDRLRVWEERMQKLEESQNAKAATDTDLDTAPMGTSTEKQMEDRLRMWEERMQNLEELQKTKAAQDRSLDTASMGTSMDKQIEDKLRLWEDRMQKFEELQNTQAAQDRSLDTASMGTSMDKQMEDKLKLWEDRMQKLEELKNATAQHKDLFDALENRLQTIEGSAGTLTETQKEAGAIGAQIIARFQEWEERMQKMEEIQKAKAAQNSARLGTLEQQLQKREAEPPAFEVTQMRSEEKTRDLQAERTQFASEELQAEKPLQTEAAREQVEATGTRHEEEKTRELQVGSAQMAHEEAPREELLQKEAPQEKQTIYFEEEERLQVKAPVEPGEAMTDTMGLGGTNAFLDHLVKDGKLFSDTSECEQLQDFVALLETASDAEVLAVICGLHPDSQRLLQQVVAEAPRTQKEEELRQPTDAYANQLNKTEGTETTVVDDLLLGGASKNFTRSETEAVLMQAIGGEGAAVLGERSLDDLRSLVAAANLSLVAAARDGTLDAALQNRQSKAHDDVSPTSKEAEWPTAPIRNFLAGTDERANTEPLGFNDQLMGDSTLDGMQGLAQADADSYMRDPSCKLSATTLGRAHQEWSAKVLGTLASEGSNPVKKKKKGIKRLSTSSIIRELGCLPYLQGNASSPSIAANSLAGQQSTNSIRSTLTSPGSSGFHRATWTPPSPPAPSSTRTDTSATLQRALSLPSIPATGLRLSPCSSANSHKASAAQINRAAVPELDMTRVRMGDDDDDTEYDPTGKLYTQSYHVGQTSQSPSPGGPKPELPQLDMSAVQLDGTGSSHPSKPTHSSGTRTGPVAPRNGSEGGNENQAPLASATSMEKDRNNSRRDSSDSAVKRLDFLGDGTSASVAALPQVLPGPRELAAVSAIPFSGKSDRMGYPNSQNINYAIDTEGSIVVGDIASKKVSLGVPTAVRLPPVKGRVPNSKAAIFSHVHVHHHHHYHVKRPAAKLDLNVSPSPGVQAIQDE